MVRLDIAIVLVSPYARAAKGVVTALTKFEVNATRNMLARAKKLLTAFF